MFAGVGEEPGGVTLDMGEGRGLCRGRGLKLSLEVGLVLVLRVCRGRRGGGADIVLSHGCGVFVCVCVWGGGGACYVGFLSPQQLFGLSFFDFLSGL